jgi:hypothetical protein
VCVWEGSARGVTDIEERVGYTHRRNRPGQGKKSR